MKLDVYSLDGKTSKQTTLPTAFTASVRADLIKRAVLSEESKLYQPKGSYRWAGLETSAKYRGRKEEYGAIKNRGISRLAREVLPNGQFGKVKRTPHAVKGRRAHPPKPEKILEERINKKEYLRALASALAASTQNDAVTKRYGISLKHVPLIVEDSAEQLNKTKDVLKLVQALKLSSILEKARRNGSKGLLFVVSESGKLKGACNLPGVDVVTASQLQVRHLAPGTHTGRIVIFSEKALQKIEERYKGEKA